MRNEALFGVVDDGARVQGNRHRVPSALALKDRRERIQSTTPAPSSIGRAGVGSPATNSTQDKLVGRHLDVVTLQAGVELEPREAQEGGGARLVPMGPLERVDDGLAFELIQRHGGGRPHRFG